MAARIGETMNDNDRLTSVTNTVKYKVPNGNWNNK